MMNSKLTRRHALTGVLLSGTALMLSGTPLRAQTRAAGGASGGTAGAAPAGNALTAPWTGPFGGVPAWDKLDIDLFPGAFTEAMDEYRQQFATITTPKSLKPSASAAWRPRPPTSC